MLKAKVAALEGGNSSPGKNKSATTLETTWQVDESNADFGCRALFGSAIVPFDDVFSVMKVCVM